MAQPKTEADKMLWVKEQAETHRTVTGAVECTYTDYGYTATARKGEPTEITQAGRGRVVMAKATFTAKGWKPKARPKQGVDTIHRAYCGPCSWTGPDRDMEGIAKADLMEHKKAGELYIYVCSRAYAKIVTEDRRGW